MRGAAGGALAPSGADGFAGGAAAASTRAHGALYTWMISGPA